MFRISLNIIFTRRRVSTSKTVKSFPDILGMLGLISALLQIPDFALAAIRPPVAAEAPESPMPCRCGFSSDSGRRIPAPG